jgi:hypothetical protein
LGKPGIRVRHPPEFAIIAGHGKPPFAVPAFSMSPAALAECVNALPAHGAQGSSPGMHRRRWPQKCPVGIRLPQGPIGFHRDHWDASSSPSGRLGASVCYYCRHGKPPFAVLAFAVRPAAPAESVNASPAPGAQGSPPRMHRRRWPQKCPVSIRVPWGP